MRVFRKVVVGLAIVLLMIILFTDTVVAGSIRPTSETIGVSIAVIVAAITNSTFQEMFLNDRFLSLVINSGLHPVG